ncbi:polynucleotide 5'-hydroxyl-kinase NOL9 isoform X2 [Monomorium pharaonis]|uniref:polynucleotide 5'-hydroxyl-kinase NOL9 isoform X2 n=1 Tax=Monomorium pharaonis TaxID=307658 RepID=UPI00063F4DEE|nr:polynucleotide 5'-hydroxyl-kinase NOL9 isoform X2 [Monomorium pharaonis]
MIVKKARDKITRPLQKPDKKQKACLYNKTMFTHRGCKNPHRDTTTNLVDDASGRQNIPSAGRSSRPLGDRRGKIKFKRFVNNPLKLCDFEQQANEKINQSNWQLSKFKEKMDTNDVSAQISPRKERNLGSPLVIDMLSDGVTSINLPPIFQQAQKTGLNKGTSYSDVFNVNEFLREGTSMTVADSINSQCSADMQIRHPEQAAPVPSNANHNDEIEDVSDNRLRDIKADNISSPVRSPMCKEFVKNRSPRLMDLDSSTKICGNPRHKNRVNLLQQPSSNQKSPKVYSIRNIVIVKMESRSRFCFTGKLLIRVLYGAVKIYGSILNKSSGTTEVYSPRGYSNVAIETSEEFPEDSIDDVWTALASEGITRDSESELQIDIDNVCPGTAVLVLQNFENTLTLFLKTFFPYFQLFPNVKNSHYISWTDPKRAQILLQAHLLLGQYDDFNYRRMIIDPCITKDITEEMLNRWRANEWSCTLIAGGQNVGKSTSVRCLINSLLRESEKVVLVDVDPGQTECTPPGCISYSLIEEPLMGPNFTHLKTPVYQLFIDEINVSQCITRYLEGIKMLIERLKKCPVLSRFPIVVNTMGFTKNLGWNIMILTIKLIRPSIILQIMSSKKKNNYDDFLSAKVVNKQECSFTFCDERFIDWNRSCEHDLRIIHSQAETVTNKWNMEPYQQRELMMISYFSGLVCDKNDSFHFQNNARSSLNINKAVPYTAPFSSLCIIPQRLFGVPASHALSVINGNIVALCGIDLTEESSQESDNISSLRVLTQRSPLCTCYGFGIIRGVDMERQEVYINTPLSISIMQHVNCLAGCMPVPPPLLQLNQGAPYVGGDAALPTSREPRRGYFRMRYQNKSNKS